MAAAKSKAAKGKKGFRGRLPSKKSINLMVVDEKKISIPKAILGVLVIAALAVAFAKFLVIDRLEAVDKAEAKANQLRETLKSTYAALENYEGVEDEFAHYTYKGMTAEELGLVDRTLILDLVRRMLPPGRARNWTVSGNILTIEVTGSSLEQLNRLGQRIEKSSIVDNCTISTANMSDKNKKSDEVWARFIIYLVEPPEVETSDTEEKSSGGLIESFADAVVDKIVDAAPEGLAERRLVE